MTTVLVPTSSQPLNGNTVVLESEGFRVTLRAAPREFWSSDEEDEYAALALGLYLAETIETEDEVGYTVVIDSWTLLHESVEEAIDILNEAFDHDFEIRWS